MGLIAVTLLAALVIGTLRGGKAYRLAALRFRGLRLLGWALLSQLLGSLASGATYAGLLALSALFVLAFLARNRRLPGIALVATGLLLNAVVVIANGAMPVAGSAADRAGVSLDAIASGSDPRHVLADRDTALLTLGDVVPIPLPLRPEVVSPGDVAVAVGLALLVSGGMLRASARRRPGGPVARRRRPARGGRPAAARMGTGRRRMKEVGDGEARP